MSRYLVRKAKTPCGVMLLAAIFSLLFALTASANTWRLLEHAVLAAPRQPGSRGQSLLSDHAREAKNIPGLFESDVESGLPIPGAGDSVPAVFFSATTYGAGGSGPYAVAVADVNGDGIPDLLVVSCGTHGKCGGLFNGEVGVLLGNGDGTFKPAVSYSTGGSGSDAIAVADLNGDGKLDLVVTNSYYTNNIGIFFGHGDGTFEPVQNANSGGGGPQSVAIADLNGDGLPDIVVANQSSCYACTDGGLVSVFLNLGGRFESAVTYSSGGYSLYGPTALAVADLNGDGIPDVAVTNGCGADGDCSGEATIGVLYGNGDGTFQAAVSYGTGGQGPSIGSIAIADVNGDGNPDLVVANSNCSSGCAEGAVGVLLGEGHGAFQPAVLYGTGAEAATSVAVADVNGDGKPDLVVANLCGTEKCQRHISGSVGVLQGNGDGTFQSAVTYSAGGEIDFAFSGVAADVNGDGLLDLLVVNFSDSSVGVLLNNTGLSKGSTATSLASSRNPSISGQGVRFTAQVTSPSGTPTGTVMFLDGSTWLGAAQLANGSASINTTKLAVGSHSISAQYQGASAFSTSVSSLLTQVVNKRVDPSKTVVATSGSPSHVGQAVTFTATMTSKGGAIPDGETVTFYDGSVEIGTGITGDGIATFMTSSLSAKKHTIKAEYPGDGVFEASKGSVIQVVEP